MYHGTAVRVTIAEEAPMRTVAIINQKGGCGKTTTAINLSAVLARAGSRVLLIDMDPQSHCAAGLGVPEHRIELDIGDAMLSVGTKPLDPPRLLWRVGRNLDLAPSRMKLAGLEASRGGLADLLDRDRRLAAVLHEFRHEYDLACIDCPPSIGLLTYNALAAADLVLIPVETGFFSLQGATRQVTTVRTLARRLGMQLPAWVLPTIHDEENTVATDLLGELHRRFKGRVAPVIVRRDASLREAASFGQAVVDYAPDSIGAKDYAALAGWVRGVLLGPAEASVPGTTEELADEASPEVHVPIPSARMLAEKPATDTGGLPVVPAAAADPRPINRAEDVARRAQEFLRRVATGRPAGAGPTPSGERAHTGLASAATATEQTDVAGGGEPTRPATQTMAKPPVRSMGVVRLESPPPAPTVTASASIARLYGVSQTNQGVLFVQPQSVGSRVAVAGSFNDWSTTSHVMRANTALGVYELCVKLPPGQFRYRLVIDGQWTADPHNDQCEPNPFGGQDSILHVGPAVSPLSPSTADARRVSA